MPKDEGLEHVVRATPPWRDVSQTECGLDIKGRQVITRAAFVAKVKDQGQQRSAMTTCMTCWNTARRWKDWAGSPSQVIARDVNQWGDEKRAGIDAELLALAAMVEAHPDEFYGFLAGLKDTASLADARKQRRLPRVDTFHRPL